MSKFPWDEFQQSGSDEDRPPIHKWPAVPDPTDPACTVVGTITDLWAWKDPKRPAEALPTPVVTLDLDDGERLSVFASQVLLRENLAAEAPQVGDRIRIKFTDLQSTTSGGTMKVFTVEVRRAEQGSLDGVPGPLEPPAPTPEPVAVANYDELGEEPF